MNSQAAGSARHNQAAPLSFRNRWGVAAAAAALAWGAAGPSTTVRAEDADRYRPYMFWRSYEWDTIWGVDDAQGISLGANLNQHWGVELSLDSFQLGLKDTRDRVMAEQTSISLTPLVRYRYPLLNDRLVPYAILGVGASFLQFNDRKPHAFDLELDAEAWKWAITAGAGIEYFIQDDVAFGFEGKYMLIDELDTRIGDAKGTLDMSSFMLSFGLRMYFDENHPTTLADIREGPKASRIYFGVRGGFHVIGDDVWGNGIRLTPVAQSYGHVLNKHFGITGGINLDRHWGIELAGDGGETGIRLPDRGDIGEYAQVVIIPQIRYRWPSPSGRWVPYGLVGGGYEFAEYNDAKRPSAGLQIDAKGFYPTIRAGGGVEYFVTRNLSFAAELNYHYTWDHEIEINGVRTIGDFSFIQALMMFRVHLLDL